ncbi:MAG TPA: hypothetical protein VMH78_00560 [Thermoplasmata archaeon]|nr:hypothetical protein [Thermoplasmata archaeon]
MTRVLFASVKRAALEHLEAGSAAREALLCQPDELPEAVFDALVPTWIRLLKVKGRS